MKQNKNLIIFDFDGVLADSFNTFYPLLRDALKHIGLSLTPDQYRDFFMGNIHQSLQDFIKDDKKYKVATKFKNSHYDKYYFHTRHKAKLFSGAIDFLKKISKKYTLTIASSGKQENIENLLNKNKIKRLFDLILANSASSKEGMINEILTKFNAKPKETIMVTDTVGDLKVAKKTGLRTAAVTWGFHSARILKSEKPDYLASSFEMLYKNIKAF